MLTTFHQLLDLNFEMTFTTQNFFQNKLYNFSI